MNAMGRVKPITDVEFAVLAALYDLGGVATSGEIETLTQRLGAYGVLNRLSGKPTLEHRYVQTVAGTRPRRLAITAVGNAEVERRRGGT